MKKYTAYIALFIIAIGFIGCTHIEHAEVMCSVTLELIPPTTDRIIEESYVITYENHNTRMETKKVLVNSHVYSEDLLKGLYNVMIDGTIILESGKRVWVRGGKRDLMFLDTQITCPIEMKEMP